MVITEKDFAIFDSLLSDVSDGGAHGEERFYICRWMPASDMRRMQDIIAALRKQKRIAED